MSQVYVGPASHFEDGIRHVIQVGGAEVGVFRHEGEFFAFENRCLHQGGPVCEGIILGKVEAVLTPEQEVVGERFSESEQHLVCPWHGWEYDLRTGRCAADGRFRLRSYDVVCRDGEVYVVA